MSSRLAGSREVRRPSREAGNAEVLARMLGLVATVLMLLAMTSAVGASASTTTGTTPNFTYDDLALARSDASRVVSASVHVSALRYGEPSALDELVEPLFGGPLHPNGPRFATEAGSASASTIDDALSGLSAGRTGGVRTVSSVGELDDLFAQLSRGGEVVENSYPGKLVRLPDGTTVGLRGASKSGGPTIDIVKPSSAPVKVHVGP